MKSIYFITFGALFFCRALLASEGTNASFEVEAGDRVAFIGDSITHNGNYICYLYDYYMTRYPDQPIEFVNAGVGGDTIDRVTARLDWDIAPIEANKAFVMLGMNDIGRSYYHEENPDEKLLGLRQSKLNKYRRGYRELVKKLKRLPLDVCVVTPTPTDDDVPSTRRDPYYGAEEALAALSDGLKEYVETCNLPLIDLNSLLQSANDSLKEKSPRDTLINRDRVHPGNLGARAMAFGLLRGVGAREEVAFVSIDLEQMKVGASRFCEVEVNRLAPGQGFLVEYLAQSLPLPRDDVYHKIDTLLPLTDTFNQEILRVFGLKEKSYDLMIDNVRITSVSVRDFEQGINLAMLDMSPHYKQSLEVHRLNKERWGIERKIRNHQSVRAKVYAAGVDEMDKSSVEQFLEALADPNNQYTNQKIEDYREDLDMLRR